MKKNLINLFLGLSLTTISLTNAMEQDELLRNNHSEGSIVIPQIAPVEKLKNLLYSSLPLPVEVIENEILPHSPLTEWSVWVATCQTCKKFLPFLYQFSGHIPFKVLQNLDTMDHLPKFTHLPLHEQVYAVTCLWLEVILECQKSEAILEFPKDDRRWEAFNHVSTKPQQIYKNFYNAAYKKDKDGKDKWEWETNCHIWRTLHITVISIKNTIRLMCVHDIGLFFHIGLSKYDLHTYIIPKNQINYLTVTQKLKPVMKQLKKFLYSAYLLEIHSKKKENQPDEKFEDFLKSLDFPAAEIEKFIKNDF